MLQINLTQFVHESADYACDWVLKMSSTINFLSSFYKDTSRFMDTPKNVSMETTQDGSTDRRGKPAIKAKTGRWNVALLLLVNLFLAMLAFFGVAVNLVLFLTRVLQQENAEAANNVSKWTGTVYIFSLVGAFLSDSYWGRYLTCAIFQMVFIVGLALLSLTSWLILVEPFGCGDGNHECNSVSPLGTAFFYLSIYLIALGNGGYQPVVATLGSEQFDENDPDEKHSKKTFFSYFYFALNAGQILSNTLLGYYEDSGKWVMGFWASTASAALALVLFLLGTSRYRHFKPLGNPLIRIAQVFVAAFRKWNANVPQNGAMLYEVEGKESAIAGSRKIEHTDGFRFLDKAAICAEEEYIMQENHNTNPWHICTVTQVEEVKRVLKMIPIWLCTILYSVAFTQMSSLFVEQGAAMNTNVGSFHIPPASMSLFNILSVLAWIVIYNHALTPLIGRLTKNYKGLSDLQRMGVGLVIGTLAMVAAGIVETERLKRVAIEHEPSSLSILWQIPQYALVGASETFMYVVLLEFFNGQAPDGLKSFGSSLCFASMSLGNYVSILLVTAVMAITANDGSSGWIPSNLNSGHLDRFFFLLAALMVVNFWVYLMCARWYKYVKVEAKQEENESVYGVV